MDQTETKTTEIKTTVVGSYPMIDWLAALPSEQAFLDATAVVLKTQELAGVDYIADGELYRFDVNHPETNGMIDYFIRPLGNLSSTVTRTDIADFRNQPGMGFRAKPAGVVNGPLNEGTLDIVGDYDRIKSLTTSPLKFTVTGPHMLSKTLLDRHYGGFDKLAHALAEILASQIAEIDADIVQLDEANITGSPEEADWAASSLNIVLDQVQNAPAVHMCFGNYGGQSIQKGTWGSLIGYINALHVDHMVLEFAFRGYDELHYLKDVRPEIGIGLGVIDVKTTVVESPETVAKRIEDAVTLLGEGRVRFVHPDCGFWMLKRSIADRKMRALVKGRDLFYGRG